MAPKTYPQQIQDLKAEKQELQDQIDRLTAQLSSLPELQAIVEDLNGQLAAKSKEDSQNTGASQAQLTDANQRANAEAARSRRLTDENTRLAHANGEMLNRIEAATHSSDDLRLKEQQIQDMREEFMALAADATRKQQSLLDRNVQLVTEIESASNELRNLRLATQRNEKILNEVRAALSSAPDLIGSLKYIVGL